MAGGAGAEVGEDGGDGFVAGAVAEGEGVVVVWGRLEVEGAGGGVVAVAGGEEVGYVVCLFGDEVSK